MWQPHRFSAFRLSWPGFFPPSHLLSFVKKKKKKKVWMRLVDVLVVWHFPSSGCSTLPNKARSSSDVLDTFLNLSKHNTVKRLLLNFCNVSVCVCVFNHTEIASACSSPVFYDTITPRVLVGIKKEREVSLFVFWGQGLICNDNYFKKNSNKLYFIVIAQQFFNFHWFHYYSQNNKFLNVQDVRLCVKPLDAANIIFC